MSRQLIPGILQQLLNVITNWILATGLWRDETDWVDSELWKDTDWILATGLWWDELEWMDTKLWNDN